MTTLTKEQFFNRHGVTPCRWCQNQPGKGSITGMILLDCFKRAEIRRLDRLIENNAVNDDWNEKLKSENHAMLVRAAWLIGVGLDHNLINADLFAKSV